MSRFRSGLLRGQQGVAERLLRPGSRVGAGNHPHRACDGRGPRPMNPAPQDPQQAVAASRIQAATPMHKPWRAGLSRAARIMPMTHLQVDPPSYLKTPPLGGTLPPPAAAFYPHLPHTVTLHLGNASLSGIETRINTRIIPRQRGFPADAHPHHPTPHEQSGLTHGIEALGSGSTGHITLRARASSGLTPRRDPPGRRPRGGDRGEPRW